MTRSAGGASPAHPSSRGGTPASPAREVASSPCHTPVPLSPEEAYTRVVAPLLFDDDASIQKTSSFRGAVRSSNDSKAMHGCTRCDGDRAVIFILESKIPWARHLTLPQAPVELGTEQQRTRSQAVATQLQVWSESAWRIRCATAC